MLVSPPTYIHVPVHPVLRHHLVTAGLGPRPSPPLRSCWTANLVPPLRHALYTCERRCYSVTLPPLLAPWPRSCLAALATPPAPTLATCCPPECCRLWVRAWSRCRWRPGSARSARAASTRWGNGAGKDVWVGRARGAGMGDSLPRRASLASVRFSCLQPGRRGRGWAGRGNICSRGTMGVHHANVR